MWDQGSLKEFLIGINPDSRLPMWWDGSEPIWVTMQKLGKKVFMYYWPGKDNSGTFQNDQSFGEKDNKAPSGITLFWI